ncbi:ATP-binding cassette domain-containing protein [Limnothrix sp. FACHB-708]|uniref:ABC transporter ATP-binding protein n=1 Tax=unclassified Limnothrix TaxID=2632864 RepID=UPI0016886F44|nr:MULTISPECIES: ATP-binding cassette domain-containing protein [unclassified Limnothrix]MBD2553223.1 ATP-binding cassette domain-containing protein [Limnothrix sp. FACHB-708]MBD2590753.1 ATP-binding cassette domain-containing protein [Limnothrix sp. FACHB-406]
MIEVEQLRKVYGSTVAIREVTFSVEPGEILGFLGPNGAGKTTTMRILTGYLPATSGTARVAGFDVHDDSMAVRERIGYLPETPPLYPDMTVEGFLNFVARIKGVSAGDRAERVRWSIERCGLSDRRKTIINKLSKGYRQRVGIAQAIVHDPPAIVLDEPTVGLDPRQIAEVRNLIKSLAGDHTVILSTHILPEVSMTCSRVAIVNGGRVVATDTPDNLMAGRVGGAAYDLEIDGAESALVTLTEGEPPQLLDRAAQLVERLQTLAGVRSVTPQGSPGDRPDRLRLKVAIERDTEPAQEIARAVIAADLGLCELRRSQATLEDVFLDLTTEEPTTPTEITGAIDSHDPVAADPEPIDLAISPDSPPEAAE